MQFNLIKYAYETLIDPQKRAIYDSVGEEGLNMNMKVGMRGMSKDDLRYYFEEKVRRTRREAIEREIGSHGIVSLGIDGRNWFGLQGEQEGGVRNNESGSVVDHVRKVLVQHGFHVSVGVLGKVISTPVSVARVVGGLKGLLPGAEPTEKTDEELSEEAAQENAVSRLRPPTLRLSATIAGQRIIAKDDSGRELRIGNVPLLAQAGMEVSLLHSFPAVPHTNTTPRGRIPGWMYKETSIARMMAESQISLSHALISRTSTVSYSRPVWGRRLGLHLTAQLNHGSRRKSSMPVLEMMLAHQVTRKGTFFVSFGTGSRWGLRLPFGIWGSPGGPEAWWGGANSKIGYTYRGTGRGGNVDVEDEDGEDEEADREGETESSGNAKYSSHHQSNGKNSSSNTNSKARSSSSKTKPPPKLYRNPNTICTFYLAANALTPSTNLLTLGFEFSRTFLALPRPRYLPLTASYPNSYQGIRATVKSNVNLLGTLSLSLILTRAVATHSRLGISVSVDPDEPGIVLSIVFRRLGQKVQIPIWVAKCMGPADLAWGFNVWATGATGLVMGWWAWEVGVMRPWEVRQRRINRMKWKKGWRERIEVARKEAEEAVQVMRGAVERKRIKERDKGGLEVVEATYGLPDEVGLSFLRRRGKKGASGKEKKRRIDVTIAVCALVEDSQLVIPGTISKVRDKRRERY